MSIGLGPSQRSAIHGLGREFDQRIPRGVVAMLIGWIVAAATACGGGGAGSVAGPAIQQAVSPPTAKTAEVSVTAAAAADEMAFDYTLERALRTSAGVFSAGGTLVRTLWRGQQRVAGKHSAAWDLRDDAGRRVADASYEIRVLAHDVRYVWEGTIGNTSAASAMTERHKSFLPPTSIAVAGSQLLYSVGYNEGQSIFHGFMLAQPQRNVSPIRHIDPYVSGAMLATDGTLGYWVNGGGLSKSTFVSAFDLATGRPHAFSTGSDVCLSYRPASTECYEPQSYRGVLGLKTVEGEGASGIAVQLKGRVLAVAWPGEGLVRLFDKRSGERIGVIALALRQGAVNQLAMTAAGDLWVLVPDGAVRVSALDTSPTISARISGLTMPLAVAADPSDADVVWIAEGGDVQQIKRFDSSGRLRNSVGVAGGQKRSTEVWGDRFCFFSFLQQEYTGLAVAGDGTLWAIDTCNTRIVRIDQDGQVREQVAYLPVVYVAAVDTGNPSRVFANFVEYQVNADRTIDQPGAWRTVRNWLNAVPPELRDASTTNQGFGGFRLVRTLSNGRTYAVIEVYGRQQLVELTAAGTVRAIGPLPLTEGDATQPYLHESGDLGHARMAGSVQQILRRRLTSFNAQGDPQWASTAEVIASAPIGTGTPHFKIGTFSGIAPPQFPITPDGRVVFFDPSAQANEGFHLGAVTLGESAWAWQASPSGPLDGQGSFQTHAVDQSVHYGGNAVMLMDSSIVFGYHGEAYRDLSNGRVGQASQFMHFHSSGLFVGQFGVPSTVDDGRVAPGRSGNPFSPTLVRQNGKTYLYHNDESVFGGLHRWRIDNLDSLVELSGRGVPGQRIGLTSWPQQRIGVSIAAPARI